MLELRGQFLLLLRRLRWTIVPSQLQNSLAPSTTLVRSVITYRPGGESTYITNEAFKHHLRCDIHELEASVEVFGYVSKGTG